MIESDDYVSREEFEEATQTIARMGAYLEQQSAQVKKWEGEYNTVLDSAVEWRDKAKAAEAIIRRVRALCDNAPSLGPYMGHVRAALAGEQESTPPNHRPWSSRGEAGSLCARCRRPYGDEVHRPPYACDTE